ncbi:hypothetical protein BH10CYA1_BH10CYA1_62100 [soil metagenome]
MTHSCTAQKTSQNLDTDILETRLESFFEEIVEMRSDIQLIKAFVQAKQERQHQQREKKRQKRLAAKQEVQSRHDRRIYEEIVRNIRIRPWLFMPMSKRPFSPKEVQLIALVANDATDKQIAKQMSIQETSINSRVKAIARRLKLNDKTELIDFFRQGIMARRQHRHQRCLALLSWLLNPPAGFYYRSNINARWTRTFGKSKTFRYAGLHISDEVFDYLRPNQIEAMRFKIKGLNDKQIATRLKLSESTVKAYFAEFRSTIQTVTAVTIPSTDALILRFREHPRFK